MKKVITRKKCLKCPHGELKSTNNAFSNSVGTYFEHRCDTCDSIESFQNIAYPHEYFRFNKSEIIEEWK